MSLGIRATGRGDGDIRGLNDKVAQGVGLEYKVGVTVPVRDKRWLELPNCFSSAMG
jgi:hypothetical protein